MSNAEHTAPKQRVIGTPFKPGVSGNPNGRPKGSRNRLADSFLSDLRDIWEVHGIQALEKCAVEQPEVLIKVVAGLMPRDLNLNIAVDPTAFIETFRTARSMLGNPESPRLRRSLRKQPLVIEHDD
jgi:hypothetical protein